MDLLDVPPRWLPNYTTLAKTRTFFRVFEDRGEKPTTLFHGNNGSRTLPTDERLVSDTSITHDGSGGSCYVSGWHLVPSVKQCYDYLGQFSADRKLVICPVRVWGLVWEKAHSPHEIYLAKNMKVQAFSWRTCRKNLSFNPAKE